MSDEKNMVKIRFRLERDEEGWPPAESEGLWAEVLPGSSYTLDGSTRYRVDNTPWFVHGIAVDDVITAEPDEDGTLWASELVQPSGRLTIRLVPYAEGPFKGDPMTAATAFDRFGVQAEVLDDELCMAAFDLGPTDDLRGHQEPARSGRGRAVVGLRRGVHHRHVDKPVDIHEPLCARPAAMACEPRIGHAVLPRPARRA